MVDTLHNLDIPANRDVSLERQSERRKNAVMQAQKSAFFRGMFDKVDLDNVIEPEEWAKIPILDKEQLRNLDAETFYNDFCIGARRDITEYWRSGGSTGRPLFYPRTELDIHYGKIGFKRVLNVAGFGPDDIAHLSLPLGIHPAGHMMARCGSELGVGMVWAGGGNTLPSKAQLDLLTLFKPTAWIGMASYGIQLANLARSEGIALAETDVAKILCTAEPLSASKRTKISELWGAQVRDAFGMTEMMMLGAEDASLNGFRFWDDYAYPEVLDPETFEPVAEGEEGLLVVTSLVTNNATPFVRWNTGDIVTMRYGDLQGSPYDVFPLIKHAHRTAGFVKVRGVNVGFTDFEDLMFKSPLVTDFRVEIVHQNDRDEIDLHLEVTDSDDQDQAIEALRDLVLRTFDVNPRIILGTRGDIAKAFEGNFKPVRFADLR